MAAPEDPEDPIDADTSGLPIAGPDSVEEAHAEQIDNIVPTHGYSLLPVVGLGGSAGSIHALRHFFENMAGPTGAAYVVVLHLSPEHESMLPQLLQRHSTMPVRTAKDGARFEANHVYVIPPGKHLVAADGHLRLTEMQHERGRRVAVDLFFRSLADTHGPHATAIVLSGADADGAIGLRRIKERGGLTIAQDPEEAEHPGMPNSAIATGMVDWVLRVGDMPGRIAAYLASESRLQLPPEDGPQPAKPVDPPADQSEALLREVLTFLRVRTGRDFSYYKRATIVRRISRRMQVSGVVDLSEYLKHLRTHPGEAGALLQDLLISVTNFFRDREAFQSIEEHIPELFRNKKPDEPVRVWCPACATGEEAYSFAMLLLEHARRLDSPPTLQVFGCDLDEEAIQVARAGFYPDTIAADVSEERLRRFFTKEPGGWRVRRELRELVLFAAHDLLKDAPFSRMDLISCRNLLIYLNRDAQERALEIFNFALKPGGLLFLGVSESVEEGSALFTPVHKKHRIYRHRPVHRIGLSIASGPADGALQRVIQQHERLKHTAAAMPGRAFLAAPAERDERDRHFADSDMSASELHFRLLGRFGPASLVVNAEHDIVHLSENANRYLQMPEGEPTRNLLLLVHPMLRVELRAALLRAGESGQPVDIPRRSIELPGGKMTVGVRVVPAGDLAPDTLLVLFEAYEPGAREDDIPSFPGTLAPDAVIQQLERELIRTKATLRDTVEQHEAATEEFRASNEELQAMNEELRAAGEELETGREELQSVNEELTTVNAEFRSRVEELARANSDLHNLISATQIATVFLGRELQVMRYTPPAGPLFNLIASDIGRPIAHLNRRLEYPELAADAEQVLRTLVPIERELREDGRWFLARVLPYRTLDDHIAGVVLTFVDITERRRAEQALAAQNEAFQAAIKDAPLEASLGPLVRLAVEQAGADARCAFYIANRNGTELRHIAGMPDAYAECVDGFRIGADSLACGLAVHTGQPVIAADVTKEPRWKDWLWLAEQYEFRACWSFPIETERKVIGTLAMYFKQPREATPRDYEAAAVLTRVAAIIISRSQEADERANAEVALRESEAMLATELADTRQLQLMSSSLIKEDDARLLYQQLVEAASSLMRSEMASLQMLLPERNELLLLAEKGFAPASAEFWQRVPMEHTTACGLAVASSERIVVPDVELWDVVAGTPDLGHYRLCGIRAVQSTPLITRAGRLVGMISTHWRSVHRPSERDLNLIDVLARQAADLIERQLAREVLRESEERLRAVANIAPDLLWISDSDGAINWCNDRWMAYTGQTLEQALGWGWVDTIHPDDRGDSARRYREAVEQGKPLEHEHRIRNAVGEYRWHLVRAEPMKDENLRSLRMVGAATDIHDLRMAVEALRESQQRFQLIVENAREYAIFAMDLERRITSWNAGAQAILGYTHEEAIGKSGDFIFTAEDRAAGIPEREAAKALAEGRANDERWHVRKDGSHFWGSGIMTSMRDANGAAIGLVKIFRDQTGELYAKEAVERSRQELRAALEETEAARDEAEAAGKAKDRFLAVLSHELRTPLTPLLLAAQMLERAKSLPPNVLDALAVVQRNVRLEAHLIDDLLDATRISTGKLELNRETISIHKIIKLSVEVATPDIEAKGQRLMLDLATGKDLISGDVKRLQQVFWNLLKNASKFTPAGGEITIRSHLEPARVWIEVSDTGVGFEPEAAERIFAAFEQGGVKVTREFGGLGLGLAIAKASVEAHGGIIRGASAGSGKGASFTLELPLADPE